MALEKVLKNVDLNWINNEFRTKGEDWRRRWVDWLDIMNADRVQSAGDSLLLYVFNHIKHNSIISFLFMQS
ncbi:MAG: hypothetical protein AABX08_01045 [Nanoarchaeota archaeon]